jgi:hypothetical protein
MQASSLRGGKSDRHLENIERGVFGGLLRNKLHTQFLA